MVKNATIVYSAEVVVYNRGMGDWEMISLPHTGPNELCFERVDVM